MLRDVYKRQLLEGELASKVLAALREHNLPQLAAKIAPDWDLPTEAVQSGLETLRSDVYKRQDVDALLDKMAGISFVVNPTRQDAITRDTLSNDDFDGEMDDASYHIEGIEEKELPIDPINAYNHMAIYMRWCMAVSYTHLLGAELLFP